jgi:putative hydrolase of the HAD superfamily
MSILQHLSLTRRPAALLLDAGDTLIFFDGSAVASVLAAEGIAADVARLEAALHPAKRRYPERLARGGSHLDGWSLLMLDLLELSGVAPQTAQAALPALKRAHLDFNFWRRVPAGLIDALERAKAAGLRLGVVSNSEGRLREVLDRVGLSPHLELALDSQLEGVHKPDPEIFRRALARMGVAAEAALYAGDIPEVDVLGARGAGMAGVLIDAFGHYQDHPQWPRMPSVPALIDALLTLPPG